MLHKSASPLARQSCECLMSSRPERRGRDSRRRRSTTVKPWTDNVGGVPKTSAKIESGLLNDSHRLCLRVLHCTKRMAPRPGQGGRGGVEAGDTRGSSWLGEQRSRGSTLNSRPVYAGASTLVFLCHFCVYVLTVLLSF